MWRPNERMEEDASDPPGIDPHSKRRRSGRRAWRDGLDVRSYRAFERALVGSVDPRSVIELALVHRLASLLWRLRRASAIETGLFEIQRELAVRRADREACKELGKIYELAEIGEPATIDRLLRDLEVEDRLDAMIDKCLKRSLFLRGFKSLPTASSSAPPQPISRAATHSGPHQSCVTAFHAPDVRRARPRVAFVPSEGRGCSGVSRDGR
jgi:hypothetical protein